MAVQGQGPGEPDIVAWAVGSMDFHHNHPHFLPQILSSAAGRVRMARAGWVGEQEEEGCG